MGRSGDGKRNILWGWPYFYKSQAETKKTKCKVTTDSIVDCFLHLKESTRESTAPDLITGMKAIRSGIARTLLCLYLTLRTGAVGLKFVE